MSRFGGHSMMGSLRRRRLLLVFGMTLAMAFHGAAARADETLDREYRIKAAFVYNFLKFVEGGRFSSSPDRKTENVEPNEPVMIGVLGTPPSRIAFEEFKDKKVDNRPVHVQWFKGFADLADDEGRIPEQHPNIETIRKCHVLFVCPSEKSFLPRILSPLRDSGVLTIADVPSFLEAGGVINLVVEDKKIRFEVNLAAAARAHLVIRSSLLRLAVKNIEHDRLETDENQENSGGSGHP
jgi:hypothetical protein